MRVRITLLVAVVTACCAMAASANAAARVTVPIVNCSTSSGAGSEHTAVPRRLVLRDVPSSTASLVAYSNAGRYLIAPPHLRCVAAIGADGNATIQAWPVAQARPGPHGAGSGLTLSVIPACVGCKALATCHYFPTFRRYLRRVALNCRQEPPPGERLRYLSKRLVAFVDPPFVNGAGLPSGAGLRSTGLVGIRPGASQVVFTSSCTLPAAQHDVCDDSAAAARSFYSRPR
jgi:hypothetical protein